MKDPDQRSISAQAAIRTFLLAAILVIVIATQAIRSNQVDNQVAEMVQHAEATANAPAVIAEKP